MLPPRSLKRLSKKAKRGFRGYPVATIAYYGPDNTRASKVAVGIIREEGGETQELERWFSNRGDVRHEVAIAEQILAFIGQHGALTVVMVDSIIGCPHEEGVDYQGPTCPHCPYWAGRDRWTGKLTS